MPTQVTIKNVSPGTPWSNDHGTFHPFSLSVDADGTPQLIEVNRKPESPPLEIGQQVWVETKPGRNGALRGKIVPAPEQQTFQPANGQQQSFTKPKGDFRPGTQSAIKSAVTYAAAFPSPPDADTVVEIAKTFFVAMTEMES